MSTQVTLRLPDELYENAKRWAALTQRDVSETLTNALSIVLTPVHTNPKFEESVHSLSDEEVLTLTKTQMKPEQGQRLNRLLEKQRESQLVDQENLELLALMQVYEQLWVRQSEALAEAVERGILPAMLS